MNTKSYEKFFTPSEENRLIISNETANDQDSIIPNSVMDFTRFEKNPVMFYRHGHDKDFGETPIGHWEDWRLENNNWTAIPVFSKIPEVGKLITLFSEGNLKSASIGGACLWATDNWGKEIITESGYKTAEKFILYEVSLVPLPSNKDATKLEIKLYSQSELTHFESIINKSIINKMGNETNESEKVLSDNEVKSEIKTGFVNWVKSMFAKDVIDAPNHMKDEPDGDEPVVKKVLPKENLPEGVEQESETEAEDDAKAKKAEAEEAEEKAEKEAEEAEEEAEEAEEEAKSYAKKINEAEDEAEFGKICKEAKKKYEAGEMPDVIKKAIEKKKAKFKTKNESILNVIKPQMKTKEEMAAEGHKIIDNTPKIVVNLGRDTTYTELRSSGEGRKIIERVTSAGGKSKTLRDHSIVLNSIINDPKFAAVVEKCTINDKTGNRSIAKANLTDLASRLMSGNIETINFKTGKTQSFVELSTSDDALATPDTIAVEWLSLFLYRLFASNQWKSEIPMFAATETGKNLGVIWTNINADPIVYKGTQPTNPANYSVADQAVSMKLIPFWLQPMLWTPLTMALLRYDQMATQWEQALMKFNTTIDDALIYALAGLIPVASRIFTSGSSLAILPGGSDLNEFVLNPNFYGTVNRPVLADTLRINQLFKKQNYPDGTKFIVTLDPTADYTITNDTDTKSLLTRFVNSEGDELIGYKHAMFRVRSKLALYDTHTGNIIDPDGVIPTTSVGAMLAFVPSQVGLGIGNLDIFMIQDPTNYGYKMSADVRMGASLLRSNGYGAALYTYLETHSGA
jgi:hypothetical protein